MKTPLYFSSLGLSLFAFNLTAVQLELGMSWRAFGFAAILTCSKTFIVVVHSWCWNSLSGANDAQPFGDASNADWTDPVLFTQ